LRLRSGFGFEHEARAPKGLSAILTMAILTMAILTMAVLTMAIPLRVSAVPGCTPSAPW
jgi:hypothetical protein